MKLKFNSSQKLNYNYLTFIPARSGSKELKNKNLQKINNKSLLEYSVNFIKKIGLKKILFCKHRLNKICEISKKTWCKFGFLRSKNSKSNSQIDDAIIEFLKYKNFKL